MKIKKLLKYTLQDIEISESLPTLHCISQTRNEWKKKVAEKLDQFQDLNHQLGNIVWYTFINLTTVVTGEKMYTKYWLMTLVQKYDLIN